jgi:hypothetical protein
MLTLRHLSGCRRCTQSWTMSWRACGGELPLLYALIQLLQVTLDMRLPQLTAPPPRMWSI